MAVRRPFTRQQRTTILHGMLAFVVMLVILQLWLLTATMNAYLGGDDAVICPAAGASADELAEREGTNVSSALAPRGEHDVSAAVLDKVTRLLADRLPDLTMLPDGTRKAPQADC